MESHSQDWPGEDPVSVLFTAILLWFLGSEFGMEGEEEEGKEVTLVLDKGEEVMDKERSDGDDQCPWGMGKKVKERGGECVCGWRGQDTRLVM